MKKTFVKTWNKSTQVRKQRKFRYHAALHTKGNFLHVHLSKDLRTKYGQRNIRVRKGDRVKVVRGHFRGNENKVERVDAKHLKVYVTGCDHVKRDGNKTLYPLQPSNLILTQLDSQDKYRFKPSKA